jgi:hypothetical protein
MSALDQLKENKLEKGKIKKTNRKKKRKKSYRELERKFLKQLGRFTVNRLHQGHLLHLERVMRVLKKKKI